MSSSNDQETIQINVLDEPFRIHSEADEEYTREIASHVDQTLREIRKGAPTLEPFQMAVLGAMGISDELFRTRQKLDRVVDAQERIAKMTELVDGCLHRQAELAAALGREVE